MSSVSHIIARTKEGFRGLNMTYSNKITIGLVASNSTRGRLMLQYDGSYSKTDPWMRLGRLTRPQAMFGNRKALVGFLRKEPQGKVGYPGYGDENNMMERI